MYPSAICQPDTGTTFLRPKIWAEKGMGPRLLVRFECHLTLAGTRPPLSPRPSARISQAYLERRRKRRQKRGGEAKNLGLFLRQESRPPWTKKKLCVECAVSFKATVVRPMSLSRNSDLAPRETCFQPSPVGIYYPFSPSRQINPGSRLPGSNLHSESWVSGLASLPTFLFPFPATVVEGGTRAL